MTKHGRYYLSRITKLGSLDHSKLISALESAATISVGKYAWTITDTFVKRTNDVVEYVYGTLSKFNPQGIVRVIDDLSKSQSNRIEPNLIAATSPFVYIPKFSGIAYLRVWNHIEREIFPKRFSEIIRATYGNFFVDCVIEPITDLRSFAIKLASIDTITELSAKVHPPNPLFGRAWKSLNDYIKGRTISELDIKERGDEKRPINTKLPQHVKGLLQQESGIQYVINEPIDITDAAILMAADGYGSGKVVGIQKESTVIIRTSETHRSFLFASTPQESELFDEADKQLEKISKDRDMEHE